MEGFEEEYEEMKSALQILFLVIALLINISLFTFMFYKIFVENSENDESKLNVVRKMSLFYVACTIFACLYNLLYRFIVSIDGCILTDIIEEFIVAFTRSILLICYVVMIDKACNYGNDSIIKIKKKYIISLYIFIITVHMIILPSIYISFQTSAPIQTKDFGVYCFNDMTPNNSAVAIISLYQITDALIAIFLCGIFVYQLRKLLKLMNSHDVNNDIDIETNKEIKHLQNLIRRALVLTLISIISSWIIIAGGRFDGANDTFWRWIYPLDYVFNALCVFLWLKWSCSCICLKQIEYQQMNSQIVTAPSTWNGNVGLSGSSNSTNRDLKGDDTSGDLYSHNKTGDIDDDVL